MNHAARTHRRAVALTSRHLRRDHWQILTQRWATPHGQVDLIAADRNVLVIVEVRARTGTRFSTALQVITRDRAAQLRTLATAWTDAHGGHYPATRIDLIGVLYEPTGGFAVLHTRKAG